MKKLIKKLQNAVAATGAFVGTVAVLALIGYGLGDHTNTHTGWLLLATFVTGIGVFAVCGTQVLRRQMPMGAILLSMGILIFLFL